MAVAADSHRDFLIPEHTVTQYVRQPMRPAHLDALRLFLFVFIVPQGMGNCKRFQKN